MRFMQHINHIKFNTFESLKSYKVNQADEKI